MSCNVAVNINRYGKRSNVSGELLDVYSESSGLSAETLRTDAARANLSLVGNVMIFCVGINLVWGKKIRVANLLPAIVVAVIAAFLPGL